MNLNNKIGLFNENLIKEKIAYDFNMDEVQYSKKKAKLEKWIKRINDGTLSYFKEEQLQGEFIRDIFTEILGAKDVLNSEKEWNVLREEKTKADGTKADAVLGFFDTINKDYRIAIELKGPQVLLDSKQRRKNDNRTPVEQGFSYLPKYGKKCKWLIVSNYREIRLYNQSDSTEYELFKMEDLHDDENFIKFLYLMSFNTLVSKDGPAKIETILEENIAKEKRIENDFYQLYSNTRINLFNTISRHNTELNPKLNLEKTQKLLDRFIFVCFIEDRKLIPPNAFHDAISQGKNSYSEYGVWENVRGLFNSIDLGNNNKGINKFNGGLFKKDSQLDNLIIPNDAFEKLEEIASFDFNSDLNVNILGHIFEQSITDLEEIRATLVGETFDLKKGKRKKEGIFYTPKDTTKYIVENTIGTYLAMKKKELGEDKLPKLSEQDKLPIVSKNGKFRYSNKLEKHIDFWLNYKDVVENIKILDPACGSGAFLNAAFDYLYQIGNEINDTLEQYRGFPSFFELDRTILQKNLFGVDINKESIEISKLSLWLKTANKNKQLTTLDHNIKCGNSLNYESGSEGSFYWNKDFKDILEEGGFDIIIGNPPYVRNTSLSNADKEFYLKNYYSANGQFDLYVLFNELAVKLVKPNGIIGFIQPNKFISAEYGEKLLNLLNNSCEFLKIKNVSQNKIFKSASVYPYIFIYKKIQDIPEIIEEKKLGLFDICKSENLINFEEEIKSTEIIKKIDSLSNQLSILTSNIKRGLPNKNIIFQEEGKYEGVKSTTLKVPYYMPQEFSRFSYVSAPHENEKVNEFNKNTIMIPRTVKTIRAVLNDQKIHIFDRIYYFSLIPESDYNIYHVLAFLNSNLNTYYYNNKYGSTKIGGGYFDLKGSQIKELPIPKKLSKVNLTKLEKLCKESLRTSNLLDNNIKKFKSRMSINLGLDNVSRSLEDFYLLEYADFLKELKKKKVTLKLSDQDEWETYFNDKKELCTSYLKDLSEIQNEINSILYKCYKLKPVEIDIIEETIKNLSL